jgi:hypothetical protein
MIRQEQTMTADAIANVIADLRDGQVRHAVSDVELNGVAVARGKAATIVDSTTIYTSLVARDKPIWIYEDHPNIAPPWENAAICYVNEHGNVIVMQASVRDPAQIRPWDSDNPIEWYRVRWIIETFLWLGGKSTELGAFPVTGPIHMWRHAVYGNGEAADMRWYHLCPECPMESWDMAHLVLLGSLNFMACRNIQLVEPVRPRALRRRLERLGVSVKTINVLPVGKTYRGDGEKPEPSGMGVPLTSVHGHFAHYGPEYGRGLLFGKLSGKFWIPQFARGSAEHGISEHGYKLRVDT